jgi:CoA:oxalate CoA-transferase
MTDSSVKALSGVRVLDLTRVMSGPYCTAMLADLGAEVIKIEQPESGDISRDVGPYVEGQSAYFALLNRGKKSMTLNLKSPRAVECVLNLAAQSDVLVENFRPGAMERLGLGYASVSEANPRLVYASISGFGHSGPFSQLPAYDLVVQAMSGIMNLTGERDGRSIAVGESIADICAGIFASWGILAALIERDRTGKGRHLDIAMLDCMFSMLITALSRKLAVGEEPTRGGNRHPQTYPVDSFNSQSGDFVLVCFGDKAFHDLANAIGRADLTEDPRFRTNADRNANEDELRRIIGQWAGVRSRESAVKILSDANVPCGPVWDLNDLMNSGHVEARGLLKDGEDGSVLPFVCQPVKFSHASCAATGRPPKLGEHTEEVLRERLRLGSVEIDLLRAARAI